MHDKSPRAVTFLLAGCLPFTATLHLKQLTLFLMICRLPNDPLHAHAVRMLTLGNLQSKSWFLEVRTLCLLYGLQHPLYLLRNSPPKEVYKRYIKRQVILHWEITLQSETMNLHSLVYLQVIKCSLSKPHPI